MSIGLWKNSINEIHINGRKRKLYCLYVFRSWERCFIITTTSISFWYLLLISDWLGSNCASSLTKLHNREMLGMVKKNWERQQWRNNCELTNLLFALAIFLTRNCILNLFNMILFCHSVIQNQKDQKIFYHKYLFGWPYQFEKGAWHFSQTILTCL